MKTIGVQHIGETARQIAPQRVDGYLQYQFRMFTCPGNGSRYRHDRQCRCENCEEEPGGPVKQRIRYPGIHSSVLFDNQGKTIPSAQTMIQHVWSVNKSTARTHGFRLRLNARRVGRPDRRSRVPRSPRPWCLSGGARGAHGVTCGLTSVVANYRRKAVGRRSRPALRVPGGETTRGYAPGRTRIRALCASFGDVRVAGRDSPEAPRGKLLERAFGRPWG